VNLIRGANGSGKTSLLEAIELGICGGIRRQGGQNPANSSLVLGYVGDAKRIGAPVSDVEYYRNKDAQWYGGYYRRVNKLCENFGRFNFFDTDAGFRLSHGKTGSEIQEAIEALFLGEYAASLEAIMRSCLERFQIKAREFSALISRAGSEKSKIETDLATVRKIKNTTETLSKELTAKCASGGWLKVPNKMRQSELVTLEGNIGDACAQLETAVRSIGWRSDISLKSLSEDLTKLKNADKEFAANETNKEKNAKSSNEMRESSEFLVAKLTLLQRLAAYHAEEDGFKLRGFGEATESKRVRHDELKEAAAQIKNIELSAFEQNTAMFADVFKEFDANFTSKKKQVNQKKRRIDELRKQFGEIKSLVEQIRGLGRHLCEYNPGVKECPVCGAEYDAGLLERIKNAKATTSMDSSLRELVSEAAAEEKQLAAIQAQWAALDQLRDAAMIAFGEEMVGKKSVKFIAAELSTVNAKLASAKSELDAAIATAKRLKLRGFTETELASLIQEAEDGYELTQNQITKASVLTSLIELERKQQDGLKKAIAAAEKTKKELEAESSAILKRSLGSSNFDEPLVEIEKRIGAVNKALALAKAGKDEFSLEQDDEFSTVHDRLKVLGEAVTRIRESLKQVEEKDELEKKWVEALDASKTALATNKQKNERADRAIEVLERLLNGKNKSAYLTEIIDIQRKRLVELFKAIHAPEEFDGVRFNGDIYLNRRGGGSSRLSEISTGQRSALALSIFLSMNSSVDKKAPWLIFDDPIAYIDDLNVLSFLDSLRNLVINGDRQMFFATANSKVASLFARKFDFLGDSFREIALDRAEG
jgi:DNA repair exonuclease SbcCD ATPase subunit